MGSEQQEHRKLVGYLNTMCALWCHVPNGGQRSRGMGRSEGVKAGVPDFLVFSPPPGLPGRVGTALELKRAGAKPGAVRAEQKLWLRELEACGWHVLVGFGAADACAKLVHAGYNIPGWEGPVRWEEGFGILEPLEDPCEFCGSLEVREAGSFRVCKACRRSWEPFGVG